MLASTIPATMHCSHDGKNDPRILNDGARLQPLSIISRPKTQHLQSTVHSLFFITVLPCVVVSKSDLLYETRGSPPAAAAGFAPTHLRSEPAPAPFARQPHPECCARHRCTTPATHHTTATQTPAVPPLPAAAAELSAHSNTPPT